MLEFEYKKSKDVVLIRRDGESIAEIRRPVARWSMTWFNNMKSLRSDELRQIADKLDELNGVVIDQRDVVMATREECAALCDKLTYSIDGGGNKYRRPADAEQCAIAIRNLSKDPK